MDKRIFAVRLKHASSQALASSAEEPYSYKTVLVVAERSEEAADNASYCYRDSYENDVDAEVHVLAVKMVQPHNMWGNISSEYQLMEALKAAVDSAKEDEGEGKK